ncbi:hypothetical protein MTR_6g466350 [Medicago truncatula]|uniref:Uncharacterized protein n=1 Tax=Medicago truncatula TaxID=3880 RepID=G7ZXE2_MEDTR|nr:hypothetical protein MTR_6g466350 [Medicago truncatula]
MTKDTPESSGVDLAKKLEECLLKICSCEITVKNMLIDSKLRHHQIVVVVHVDLLLLLGVFLEIDKSLKEEEQEKKPYPKINELGFV